MGKNKADKWKFEKSYDFYTELDMRESTGRHGEENNETSYIRSLSDGEAALVDAGYCTKKATEVGKDPNYNNNWTDT